MVSMTGATIFQALRMDVYVREETGVVSTDVADENISVNLDGAGGGVLLSRLTTNRQERVGGREITDTATGKNSRI